MSKRAEFAVGLALAALLLLVTRYNEVQHPLPKGIGVALTRDTIHE